MKKVLVCLSLLLAVGFSTHQTAHAQEDEDTVEKLSLLFVAYPQTITQGKSVLLEWKSEDADYCIASGAWKGKKNAAGNLRVKSNKKSVYSLQCFSEDGTSSDRISKTISVVKKMPKISSRPPEVKFEISSDNIQLGNTATLTWEAKGASICYAKTQAQDEGWRGLKQTQGSEEIFPEESSTYSLRCVNGDGISSKEYQTVIHVSEYETMSKEEVKHETPKQEIKQEIKEEKKEQPKQEVKEEKKQEVKQESKQSSLARLAIALDPSTSSVGKSVAKGETNIELARFILSASDKDVIVGSIQYASDPQLLNIKTYNGAVQIGNTLVLRSSSKVLELNPPLVIPAGNSSTLRVVADVAYDASGSVSVGITNIYPPANTTNFSTVTGMLPLYGNALTVKGTDALFDVVQPVKVAVALDVATSLSRKISQGDIGVNFGQFTIMAAEKDVSLKGVRIVSNPSGSVLNTKVTSENMQMGTTLVSGEGYVEFESPFVVKAFTTRTLRLVADVSSSAKSSIRLGISDLVFSPEQKGVVSGTLPVYGSTMTLGENWDESLKIVVPPDQDFPHSLTFQRGSVDNRVLTLDFAAPSGMKKAYITQVAYRCSQDCMQLITSARLKDQTNNLYIGNTVLATKEGGTLLTFTLTNPYIINENIKGRLSLIVDFQKSTTEPLGTSSLFSFTMESIGGIKENGSTLSIAGQPLIGVMHTLKN